MRKMLNTSEEIILKEVKKNIFNCTDLNINSFMQDFHL